jgi:hypothetical protein
MGKCPLRAISHMITRARDHYTPSTLIGGKGVAHPSSLHTTLEGPTKYVNARWMQSLHEFLHHIKWIMFHGRLDYFRKPRHGGRPRTKPGDHGTPNAHSRWFILFYYMWRPAWIDSHWNNIWLRSRSHMTLHYTWESVTTYMILKVCWDNGLWTLSFGLSQFSWSRLLGSCVKWPCWHDAISWSMMWAAP